MCVDTQGGYLLYAYALELDEHEVAHDVCEVRARERLRFVRLEVVVHDLSRVRVVDQLQR